MTYIQKTEFYTLPEPLGEGYDLSESNSLEDFKAGKIILLNEAQAAFKEANPNATPEEVFNMTLTPTPVLTLAQVKARKIAEIDAYDISPAVNSFFINGISMWLDRNTRASLFTTIAAYKASGITTITLWTTGSNPVSITLLVSQLESLLTDLEIYAKASYDVTANHKANAQALTAIDDVNNYNYRTNYPAKLNVTI